MSLMDIVAELLEDSQEIRPHSPSIRPAKKPASKRLFAPFAPFAQKDEKTQLKGKRAQGYGCCVCGNSSYQQVEAWEMLDLPASSEWQQEHKQVVHWQCEGCKAIYEIIGGSEGLVLIN